MPRPKKSKTKEIIINECEKLISIKGTNEISLQEIAKWCNISKGTLYYHYQAKEDIILDIIKKHINELETEYFEWLNRHYQDLTPERFLDVIFYKGSKLFNRAKMHIFIINECLKGKDKLREEVNKLWIEWEEVIKSGIIQVFPKIENKDDFAKLLMIILDGLVVQEVMHTTNIDSESLVRMVKRIGEYNE